MPESDIPPTLEFVDPAEADNTWRIVLWSAPGEGKSTAAATAPDPILVLSADRPGAYRYARRRFPAKDIRETRYANSQTLDQALSYLSEHPEVRTVVIDPFHNIYDRLVDQAPKRPDGDPNYQAVNKRLLDFLYSLRHHDVNVVIVAHEKLNDGKRGDGKLYPQLGGPSLINKVLAESDIVAHVEREPGSEDTPARYMAQLTPVGNLVCKEGTGIELGERLELDLSAWFELARPDTSDLPWGDETMPENRDPDDVAEDGEGDDQRVLEVGPS
jgi:hypothetical protein